MKTQNKKKIVVSALAIAMGAALAGSISGSVAWYQYSTKAAVQFTGTSIGTEGRLQVKLGTSGEYKQYVTPAAAGQFRPISATGSVGSLSYLDHPVYQVAQLPAMDAENPGYIDYDLYFKLEENKSNPEDFQHIQTPIMIMCMLSYYLAIMAGMFNGSAFIKILSYVPLISYSLSPALLIIGQIGVLDVLISIVVLILFVAALVKYGMKIYKVGVLNYSTDKLLRRIFKATKM